jgi:transcription antitermination factor NusG
MSLRWYVVCVGPQFDAIVARNLARPDPIAGRPEFEVLWPRFKISRIRFGAIIEDAESMFPGYLFVRTDCRPEAPAHWQMIRKMNGVDGFLPRQHEYPLPVSDELVELLQECTIDGESKLSYNQLVKSLDRYFNDLAKGRTPRLILEEPKDDPFCQVGFIVPIIDGHFASCRGECLRADYQTAVVRINIFGRECEVTILQSHIGHEKWKKTQHVDRPRRKAYIRRQEPRVALSLTDQDDSKTEGVFDGSFPEERRQRGAK